MSSLSAAVEAAEATVEEVAEAAGEAGEHQVLSATPPPSSTHNSSKRPNFANPTVGTRCSPRLHAQQQRQTLATPRVLMDTIAESPPSQQSSPDLLATTQQASQGSTVYGTELPPRNITVTQEIMQSQLTALSGINQDGGEATFSPYQGSVENDEELLVPQENFEATQEAISPNQDQAQQMEEPSWNLAEAASDFTFPERMRHFLGHNLISEVNRVTVENCIIAEAGMKMEKSLASTLAIQQDKIVFFYHETIQSLGHDLFESRDLRLRMYERLFKGRQDGYGKKDMMKKWTDIKATMKKQFSKLPRNYHQMSTGVQLKDLYEKLIMDMYKRDYVSVSLISLYCK